MIVCTRRCCAPSWRSRTTRWRSLSAVATIRARDAARSARACMFEIAVATSAVNSLMRDSVLAGSGSSVSRRRSSRPRGVPRRSPASRPRSECRRREGTRRATRRPARSCRSARTVVCGTRSRTRSRRPASSSSRPGWRCRSHPNRHHCCRFVPFEANELRVLDAQEPSHLLRDRSEDGPRRRLARDQRGHPAQRDLFLGEAMHIGLRLGAGDRRGDELRELGEPIGDLVVEQVPSATAAPIVPQSSPLTMIAVPAPERIPVARMASAMAPPIAPKSSIRVGRSSRGSRASAVGWSTGHPLPTWKGCGRSLHAPSTLAESPGGLRQMTTNGTRSTCATSLAIAANTSGDAAPPATSWAIRRSDPSRAASTASCSRSACRLASDPRCP